MSKSKVSSPKDKSPVKSAQPSLVILTKDDAQTRFSRRKFNPDEYLNLFEKFKINPFSPSSFNSPTSKLSFGGSSSGGSPTSPKGSSTRIFDIASLASDFDINQGLGDDNFSSFDIFNQSTSEFSTFQDDADLFNKLQQQLNLSVFGDLFNNQFDEMQRKQKRELSRVARLQTVQKKNWYDGIWDIFGFNEEKKKDRLWRNLRKFVKVKSYDESEEVVDSAEPMGLIKNKRKIENPDDDISIFDSNAPNATKVVKPYSEYDYITNDTVAKSLMYTAKKTFESFLISDRSGLNLFMRAVIIGPTKSGKTYFLRSLLIHTLNFLVEGSQYKSFFLVPIDYGKAKIKTVDDFYEYMSDTVVESLIAQRPDLQLFQNSLRKAFKILTEVPKMKKLPKPISSQDYLRQSMKELDVLLETMHRCYNDPDLIESFISNVAVLPQTIGNIFNFDTTLIVLDHLDLIDVNVRVKPTNRSINLFDYVKFSLAQTQFLISCVDSKKMCRLLRSYSGSSIDLTLLSQFVSVFDSCDSSYINDVIKVNFVNNKIRNTLPISFHTTGGCPLFVCAFEDACRTFLRMKNDYNRDSIQWKNTELMTQINDLINGLFQFQSIPDIKDIDMGECFDDV